MKDGTIRIGVSTVVASLEIFSLDCVLSGHPKDIHHLSLRTVRLVHLLSSLSIAFTKFWKFDEVFN